MTVKEIWETYKRGVTDITDEKQKLAYAESIHYVRELSKQGYSLCKVDMLINNLKTLENAYFEESKTDYVDLLGFVIKLIGEFSDEEIKE